MSEGLDKLNTVVVKRYGGTGENPEPELALVLSSCPAPTFGLVDAEGKRYHWRQDLTRPATWEETIRYWRDRAVVAERLQEKLLALLSKTNEQNLALLTRLVSQDRGSGAE